jgi:uncharacterized protein YdaU (DUF1376 family)
VNPPAFQFYPDDFIGGTVDMTPEEVGAYIRLLCYQWGHGKAPLSKEAVDRVAGCVVSDSVLSKFPRGKNRRLEDERRKQIEYRRKQAINGAKGGRPEKRLGLGLGSNSETQTKAKKSSPSPSPSPSTDSKEGNGEIPKLLKDLPPKLNTARMVAKWGIWMNYRRGKAKVKNWLLLFNEQIEWLSKFDEPTAFEILSASIRNGWTGLFEPKQNGHNSPPVEREMTMAEMVAAAQ